MLKSINIMATALVLAGIISTSTYAAETGAGTPKIEAAARGESIGTATVASNAPLPCPPENRGASATGTAPGTNHAACTVAKENARATLRTQVPQTCAAYISSTKPCKVVN